MLTRAAIPVRHAMQESGDWIVPTFNNQLPRQAGPAHWLQMGALPRCSASANSRPGCRSALAALLTMGADT